SWTSCSSKVFMPLYLCIRIPFLQLPQKLYNRSFLRIRHRFYFKIAFCTYADASAVVSFGMCSYHIFRSASVYTSVFTYVEVVSDAYPSPPLLVVAVYSLYTCACGCGMMKDDIVRTVSFL